MSDQVAYTKMSGSYPAYINFTPMPDGGMKISVRGEPTQTPTGAPQVGPYAGIILSEAEWAGILRGLR